MKKILLALALITACSAPAYSALIISWDMSTQAGGANNFGTSPLVPTTSDANSTAGSLTRGSGVLTTGTGAARGWGGTDWLGTSEATAITANDFSTFSITAKSGFKMSLSSFDAFGYRRSGTGASNGELQYQIGAGSFTDVAAFSYSSTSSSGATIAATDLTGISALQNLAAGTTVTFRIVNWGGTNTAGTWYVYDTANTTAADLSVTGTLTAVPEPTTCAMFVGSLGMVILISRRKASMAV